MSEYHRLFGIQAMKPGNKMLTIGETMQSLKEFCDQENQERIRKQKELCSESENKQSPLAQLTAQMALRAAADTIDQRGIERDKPDGERTMSGTVRAFNALTGHALSETQGWLFMVILKIARSQGGGYKPDDYEDMAGYAALAAESEHKTKHGES